VTREWFARMILRAAGPGQQDAGPPPKRRPGARVELDQLTVMVNASLVDALVYSSPEYVATTE
jgi:hypothetical protein